MLKEQAHKLASGGKIHLDYINHARQSFLSAENETAFLDACGQPLRKSIRVNTLKINVEKFSDLAKKNNWLLEPVPWCQEGFWLSFNNHDEAIQLGNHPAHIQGLFYIQEASSMLPPVALLKDMNEKDNLLVMDMAAAPGSKTTQLAAMLKNKNILLANELSSSRLKSLHNNLVRCGVLNTSLSHLDARKIGNFVTNHFDYILLDAPCGGEGTVRKDPTALESWNLESVKSLAKLQKELILSAYQALKPGGRLVYSTCTLSKEENHQVAEYLFNETDAQIENLRDLFIGAEKSVTKEGFLHVLPQIYDSEGFFVACFTKPNNQEIKPLKEIYSSPFKSCDKKAQQTIINYYRTHFGFEFKVDGYKFLQRDKEIWLFPENIEQLNTYIKINRAGIKMAEVYPNKIRSSHDFVCCFGEKITKQKIAINKVEFSDFLQGKNLIIENKRLNDLLLKNGEIVLTFNHYTIGLAQNKKGKLKNGLPRELVKDGFQL